MEMAIAGQVLVKISFRDSRIRPTLCLQEATGMDDMAEHEVSVARRERATAPSRDIDCPTGMKLVVTILRAEGLLAKDWGGTSDPFVELYLGSQFRKTKVIDKTLSPVWNETFELDVGPEDNDMSVVVYDNDNGLLYGSSKEYLGSVTISVNEMAKRRQVEQWCE